MYTRIKYLSLKLNFVILFGISLFIFSCANMGMPEGGPKDISPPEIVESIPENYSKQFKSKSIKITFDEFIVLKNINQALIISPPLDEKPEIKLKGKTIIIEFNSEFLENTTYSLNFGNAIVDNNEGNVLKNFNYVFSTGDIIDSLSISGTLINSFTGKAEEDVLIMAYTNLSDSTPLTERPIYIARSLKDGSYTLNNLKDTTYKIFALKDANNNFIFDQPNEEIAFSDTAIKPFVTTIESIDTLHIDSLDFDTIIRKTEHIYYPNNIKLSLFEQETFKQYLKGFSRPEKAELVIVFNEPLTDSLDLKAINFSFDNIIHDYHSKSDSIKLWINDSSIYNIDTLVANLTYPRTDSLSNIYTDSKLIKFGYKRKESPKKLKLQTNIYPKNKRKLDLNKNVIISFNRPIKTIDTSRISFLIKEDSLFIPYKYSIIKDTLDLKTYNILFELQENKSYSLSVNDSAFLDITDIYNDSLGRNFTTKSIENYGIIILNLKDTSRNGIIQLFDSKNKFIEEQFTSKSSKISFKFLKPGGYKFKYINDQNNNKKWDSGIYINKLQPEKIDLYNLEIKVKSNWEMEIDWVPFLIQP